MDWTAVGKAVATPLVAALSAILSAVLTNMYAERRHRRDLVARERELQQRIVETLIPTRVAAYEAIFGVLQSAKSPGSLTPEVCDDLTPHLLWVDPEYGQRVLSTLRQLASVGSSASNEHILASLSQLQDHIRHLIGATELNRLFLSAREAEA